VVKSGDYPRSLFWEWHRRGFDAAVGNEAIKVRWTRGLPAYLIGVIKTVFLYYNPAQVEIILDDTETINQVSLMISVMNGRRMGGGFQMAPDSKSDDGLFDLCIAETASKGRILRSSPLHPGTLSLPEVR
jgi:diacylglycerol kinase family enzyme